MGFFQFIFSILLACIICLCSAQRPVTTKVHIIEINPNTFNWSIAAKQEFHYRASLVNLPDLPSWLKYRYSHKHEAAFLYGVPPHVGNTKIEVVALNRETYEVKRKILDINVTEKAVVAKYEVELKIDNLNVEDMFLTKRLNELCKVLTRILWPDSQSDIYMTFLASAVSLGARLPLSPHDGEGVVVHLGSKARFSEKLLELQEEVKPLWKLPACPRDYRRASVDRHFRQAGFALDWCSFRLNERDNSRGEGSPAWQSEAGWTLMDRASLPSRQYSTDFLTTLVSPVATLLILILLLSFIICFQHDSLKDESSEEFFNSVFLICEGCFRSSELNSEPESKLSQYEAVQRATSTLRSMSNFRDTIQPSSDKLVQVEESGSRPSPPPYGAAKRMLDS